jgi:hypothetical protein
MEGNLGIPQRNIFKNDKIDDCRRINWYSQRYFQIVRPIPHRVVNADGGFDA